MFSPKAGAPVSNNVAHELHFRKCHRLCQSVSLLDLAKVSKQYSFRHLPALLPEALRLEWLALEILQSALGEEHPDTVISKENLPSFPRAFGGGPAHRNPVCPFRVAPSNFLNKSFPVQKYTRHNDLV